MPLFVVFNLPSIGGFPYFVQVAEQIQVKNFVPIYLIEAFNEHSDHHRKICQSECRKG